MILASILFLSGLFISSVAAYFSILGLTTIFPGSVTAVVLMGVALEIGKLVSASWLYRSWKKINLLLKTYFILAVLTLSFVTSIGIFGYLTKAHIEGTQGLDNNSEQISLLDEQIIIERENIQMQRTALSQLDIAVQNLSAKENTTERAISVRNSQRRERTNITSSITESNKKIQELQQQKSVLNVGQRKLETEVGPIKYVAQLVYGSDDSSTIEKAIQLLTLILIFVFDPLAILLLIAANFQLKERNKEEPVSFFYTDDNTHQMKADWNPANWFKIVKTPKSDS